MFINCVKTWTKKTDLLLHTDIRWVRRGRYLNRLLGLRDDLHKFFQETNKPDFANCIEDEHWLQRLSYLADIFHHTDKLILSLQGPSENILTSNDKISASRRNVNLWKNRVAKGNLQMFPLLLIYQKTSSLIEINLWELFIRIENYFMSLSTHVYDLVRHDASVVHTSGSGQLQANQHMVGPWLCPGKPTRRAVTTMGSNDLVVGEDHMLGPSCQRYNLKTGRCGSIAFGSSPRRGKTLISSPRCLAEVSTCGKDFRR